MNRMLYISKNGPRYLVFLSHTARHSPPSPKANTCIGQPFLKGLLLAGARKAGRGRENITGHCSTGGQHSSKWPALDSGHAQ